MGFSIFYSISLPAALETAAVAQKLEVLRNTAQGLAKGRDIEISPLKWLSAQECAVAQATMNADFSFARTVCTPPGGKRASPLGTVPELALYFRLARNPEHGINIGLAKYSKDAKFSMYGEDGNSETPYDGRWYYWTFIDSYSKDDAARLGAVLEKAKTIGFETTFRDEAQRGT